MMHERLINTSEAIMLSAIKIRGKKKKFFPASSSMRGGEKVKSSNLDNEHQRDRTWCPNLLLKRRSKQD